MNIGFNILARILRDGANFSDRYYERLGKVMVSIE